MWAHPPRAPPGPQLISSPLPPTCAKDITGPVTHAVNLEENNAAGEGKSGPVPRCAPLMLSLKGAAMGVLRSVLPLKKPRFLFCKKTTNEKRERERGVSGGVRVVEEGASRYGATMSTCLDTCQSTTGEQNEALVKHIITCTCCRVVRVDWLVNNCRCAAAGGMMRGKIHECGRTNPKHRPRAEIIGRTHDTSDVPSRSSGVFLRIIRRQPDVRVR